MLTFVHNLKLRSFLIWNSLKSLPHFNVWVNILSIMVPLLFILLFIWQGWTDIKEMQNWRVYGKAFLVALLLYPFSFVIQAFVWQKIISYLSGERASWNDIEIFVRTYLMKRIPGAIWYLTGRTVFYQNRGVSPEITLTASAFEWLLLILAAGITVLVTSFVSVFQPIWVLIIAMVILVILSGVILVGLFKYVSKITLTNRFAIRIAARLPAKLPSITATSLWLGAFVWAFFVGGLILYLLLQGVTDSTTELELVDVWRIWSITGGVSLVFISVLPAGLGIREITLSSLLAPNIPIAVTLVVAILLRIVFLVGDLLWGIVLWCGARIFSRHSV